MSAFVWSETDDGTNYWANIHEGYIYRDQDTLLDDEIMHKIKQIWVMAQLVGNPPIMG